jgi:hypothetical protein
MGDTSIGLMDISKKPWLKEKNVTFAHGAVSDYLLDSLRFLYTPAHHQGRTHD